MRLGASRLLQIGDANTPMLETRIIRKHVVEDTAGSAGQAHLSAAGSLVKVANRLFVVADDEHRLAMFDLSNCDPGRLVPIVEEKLPLRHKARKAAKPDCEALLMLPAFGDYLRAFRLVQDNLRHAIVHRRRH